MYITIGLGVIGNKAKKSIFNNNIWCGEHNLGTLFGIRFRIDLNGAIYKVFISS